MRIDAAPGVALQRRTEAGSAGTACEHRASGATAAETATADGSHGHPSPEMFDISTHGSLSGGNPVTRAAVSASNVGRHGEHESTIHPTVRAGANPAHHIGETIARRGAIAVANAELRRRLAGA